jgi:hypothetical protein
MVWFVWFILALKILVIALGLRIMWVMVWEASRAPADPSSPIEHPPSAKDEDYPTMFTFEEVDERGYVSTRKLYMGCEAAVCRTPFGARILAGRHSLENPRYAWDYASVRLAEKALVYAEFNTHPSGGIVGVEDFERSCHPAAEPRGYFRRWRCNAEGRMERF